MRTTKALTPPELNEALAFQANCLFAAGKHAEVLAFLKENESYCFPHRSSHRKLKDKEFLYRRRYDSHMARGEFDPCKEIAE